jgi:hypothetical protein
MRSKLLMLSTAALLAGTLAAAGQSIQPGGGAQDKAQQGSSQGTKQTEGARDQAPKGGTQGQVQRDQDKQLKGQAQSEPDKQKSQTPGQVQRDQDKKGQTQGQAQSDKDKPKGQTQGQAERDQDKQKSQTQGQAPRDQDRQGQGPRDLQRQQGQQGEREGQRSGNVSVAFTTEQRTKIRETVFKGSNAPRVGNVTFSLNVGTPVPRTVRIVEVPEVIVEVHPEWRGYRYFIVNDELVIVEPDTLKIVAIIDV